MIKIATFSAEKVWPPHIAAYFKGMEAQVFHIDVMLPNWQALLAETDISLVFNPLFCRKNYVSSVPLWETFLLRHFPTCKLIVAGFQDLDHPNYIDLLSPQAYDKIWLESLPDMNSYVSMPNLEGINLMDKLQRFFAGHGEDSIVAVLSRLRLIVQMAQREVIKMNTPYQEVYDGLIAPSNLHIKWAEWKSRWVNYAPLFESSPFFSVFCELEKKMSTLEDWMDAGGSDGAPISNGQILEVLDFTHQQLQQIEQLYVVKELSHTHS